MADLVTERQSPMNNYRDRGTDSVQIAILLLGSDVQPRELKVNNRLLIIEGNSSICK